MTLSILAIGTSVPTTVLTQEQAVGLCRVFCVRDPEDETWLPLMYGQTGIKTRRIIHENQLVEDVLNGTRESHSVFLPSGRRNDCGPTTGQRMKIYAERAGMLALESAAQALERSNVVPESITHLVTVSCTGFVAPGIDCHLVDGLALRSTVERTHVGFMGCHGALNGLRVAQAFARADPSAVVLLCAVELCSLHYHYGWDPQKIVANALFADGAATVVGRAAGPADCWRVSATGSCILPDSGDAMSWTVGDHGFEMTLSKRVPDLIAKHLRPWLETWLLSSGSKFQDVRSWAIHPGGPKILAAVEESLSLPPNATQASRSVLETCGNMSSPTLLFILERLVLRGAARPCVALGFGPGLVAEAVLFE